MWKLIISLSITVLVNVLIHVACATALAGITTWICGMTKLPFGWPAPEFAPTVGALMALSSFLTMARLAWRMPQFRVVNIYGDYKGVMVDPERRVVLPE